MARAATIDNSVSLAKKAAPEGGGLVAISEVLVPS